MLENINTDTSFQPNYIYVFLMFITLLLILAMVLIRHSKIGIVNYMLKDRYRTQSRLVATSPLAIT